MRGREVRHVVQVCEAVLSFCDEMLSVLYVGVSRNLSGSKLSRQWYTHPLSLQRRLEPCQLHSAQLTSMQLVGVKLNLSTCGVV